MSELLAESEQQKPPYDFLSIGLLPSERAVLHERIARRFDEMLLAGLDDELYRLREKYDLNPNLPSMRCVGYRQAWEMLEGQIPRAELRDRGVFATRQFAKRQLTWLRSMNDLRIIDPLASNPTARVLAAVEAHLSV
jgi:tRNA dimethylallyltransferase